MAKDDKEVRETIEEGIAASIYKRGEQLRDAGDVNGAVVQFQRIAKEAPNTQANIAAQFDVAANLMAAKEYQKAIAQFDRFRRKYPKHKLQKQVSENLVVAYLKTDKPLYAAEELQKLRASQDPNHPQQSEVLQGQ